MSKKVFGLILYVIMFARCFEKAECFVTNNLAVIKSPRINIPWLGVGYHCNGCPFNSCENDEAIVHGYCCGCARILDHLPVMCMDYLNCPLNPSALCRDYEYMMRCCC